MTEPSPTIDAVPEESRPETTGKGLRAALGQSKFRWYWLGIWGLSLSLSIQQFAFPWLAYHLTDSTLMVGLTAFCLGTPNAILAPFGGVLADRAGRARVIRITQSLALLFSAVLAVLLLLDRINIWGVMTIATLLGTVAAFDQPARQAIVPSLVPRDALINAMALTSTAWSSTRIVGPAVGGALLTFFLAIGWGPGGVFALAAAGYGLMFLCMSRVHLPNASQRDHHPSVLRDLTDGFRYVGSNPVVATIFLLLCVASLFGMSFLVLMPVFAKEVYGVDERGLGLLVACYGVGGLLGTVIIATLGGSHRRGLMTLVGSAAFGALLVVLALSTSAVVSAPVVVLIGLANVSFLTAAHTVLQVIVPDEVRGRVMANYTLIWSLGTLGGAMLGAMAEVLGVQGAVAIGGGVVVLVSVACWNFMPAVRALD